MKIGKILRISLIILIIILISIISFVGIFKQNKNIMEAVLPEYLLSRDLKGYRMVEIKASSEEEKADTDEQVAEEENPETESKEEDNDEAEENKEDQEKTNEEESNKDENNKDERNKNYKKVKQIIKDRLDIMQVTDYIIRQNEEDGTIFLELPENDNTDRIVGEVALTGKFEVLDSDTNQVLMTNDDIQSAKAGYGTTSSGTTAVFINIQFNKDGKAKFRDITNTYVQTTVTKEKKEDDVNEISEEIEQASENEEQNKETEEPETETVTKKIAIKLDDSQLLTTYFEQEITNGLLQLTMGSSSSSTAEKLQENLLEARSLAAILNSGKMPIDYNVEQNKYVAASEINIKAIAVITGIVLAIGIVYLIIKYKMNGVLAGISIVGYVALLLIAVRYFNVEISRGGIIAIIYSIAINYGIVWNIMKEKEVLKTIGKWAIILIPTLILAITFTLTNVLVGAVLFWGIVIALLYNISVTNLLIKD